MNDISAIIVIKNSPAHLFETLSSIDSLVKEIVIADIGIDSPTLSKLKHNKKIKIFQIKTEVRYVELIREELKQYASYKYILLVDPDEIISESLKKMLLKFYQSYEYIKIPRKNIIFGKWIEHSRWWPDYQVRLFKKDAVIWPKEIHKQPIVKGKGYAIEQKEEYALIHHNYESVDEFMQKFVRYAKAEASGLSSFSLSEALKKAISEFISRYFADEGYKDGMRGFVLAFLQMFYYFLVYVYYWEKGKYTDENPKSIQNNIYIYFKEALYSINHWQNRLNLYSYGERLKKKILNKLL
ncbi:hypothetical protein HY041_03235 [Candidatus Roizmanbacteria bacterium]|nr:hypothetical protein [Candidatus Roizmanbacteria bacterium]